MGGWGWGHPEEHRLRSCQEVEREPEARTLLGKRSPSSSDWKVMSKNFHLNIRLEFLSLRRGYQASGLPEGDKLK